MYICYKTTRDIYYIFLDEKVSEKRHICCNLNPPLIEKEKEKEKETVNHQDEE